MLIIAGRGVMLLVWVFLLVNLVAPFPRPLNIFINVALAFMVLMHGLQLLLLKSMLPHITQTNTTKPLTAALQWRIFIFGAFELLAMNKKQRRQ